MTAQRLGAKWHDERRKRLFLAHPSVRALMGPNPWTALAVVVLVALQLALAVALSPLPWLLLLGLAWFVGAFVAHALGVLIHEAAHDLVFRSPLANRWLAMLANVPAVFPAAMDFREKHLKHHAHLGEPDGADTQAPQAWDFAFATSRLRTLAWHLVAPFRTHGAHLPSKWVLLNTAVQVAALVPFTALFGVKALFFLGMSATFAFAHHPLGVRRYGEHLTLAPGQPTTSYYGALNWLSFDVGYHVEHHDLPSVPWNRVRALKTAAPELYEGLAFIPSWSALLWQLLTVRGEGPARYFLERRPDEAPVGVVHGSTSTR